MATRLVDLVIDRVDLVDRGANPLAHVLLYKRQEQPKRVEPPTWADVDSRTVGELKIRKADARGGHLPIRVEDRHGPQAWADALSPVVKYSGGELWVAYHQNLKRDAIVKLAAMLPTSVKRYVYFPNAFGPTVAFPGQTIAEAMMPVSEALAKLHGTPVQKGTTMNSTFTPDTIQKGIIGNDPVVLRKCFRDFPQQVLVAKAALTQGALDAQETNELQMMDPQGRLSIDEKAAHLAARRWPDLYDGYVAAITRGIA